MYIFSPMNILTIRGVIQHGTCTYVIYILYYVIYYIVHFMAPQVQSFILNSIYFIHLNVQCISYCRLHKSNFSFAKHHCIFIYLFIFPLIYFSSYLFFFQLSFVCSIQIDKNLANMFRFTICPVTAITSTLDCP